MKQLSEIMVSESTLMLLLGGLNIKYIFPVEKAKGKKDKKLKVSLQKIIDDNKTSDVYGKKLNGGLDNIRSFDDRFDQKHPIHLAIGNIRECGIRKSILTKIYADTGCVRMGRLVGKYAIFNEVLNDFQKAAIEKKLKQEQELIIQRKKNLENWCK